MFDKPVGQYVVKFDPDLSIDVIAAAEDKPVGSFVKSDGSASAAATASSFYGIHVGGGQVYHSLCVLNAHGCKWPDGITQAQKDAAIAQLKKNHTVVRG